MLNGTLEHSLAKRWAWDREDVGIDGDMANPTYRIEADLKDLLDEKSR
jgi:hypothetical protein